VKPAPFEYHRPATVAEAVAVMAELGETAKVLAGGQSLVPMLSMRLAAPEHLVDINGLPELDYVRVADGAVKVGALARHRDVERRAASAAQPLLGQALRLVAHPTIRNRGTTVGSIVHADPAGELTAVLAVLGGSVRLVSARGERVVPAAEFFLGPLESATRPDELAVEVSFPVAGDGARSTFVEVARRHGDYAVCGVAAVVRRMAEETVEARLGLISVAAIPVVLDVTMVAGSDEALRAFVAGQVEPSGDIHASADYRRHLAGVLAVRALRQAEAA
jgi:carbon-monoxide dehydrogenase medium subunit